MSVAEEDIALPWEVSVAGRDLQPEDRPAAPRLRFGSAGAPSAKKLKNQNMISVQIFDEIPGVDFRFRITNEQFVPFHRQKSR